jgi:hypothetical protein
VVTDGWEQRHSPGVHEILQAEDARSKEREFSQEFD